jgi:CDP-diacylglycerol--glycerol-3-phosphate 3-phosphatidyltransferase/cardiolipin synthase
MEPGALQRGRLLNLPNVVSMSRLVLAAAFIVARAPAARLLLIVAASATDYLDGWLARRQGSMTRWGALIDPIADRAFVLTALSVYLANGELAVGQFFLLLTRDIATAIGFVVARSVPWLRPVVFRARWLGKIVTVLQLATLLAVILAPGQVAPLIWLVAVASVASIADYTWALWRERGA